MPIYHFSKRPLKFTEVYSTGFEKENIFERKHLQQVFKKNISAISDDLLIIAEEFSEWDEGRLSIDLLAIDKDANIVVIELKRTKKGEHMELQAIRYAALIFALTWQETIKIFTKFLENEAPDESQNAEQKLLGFLGWSESREDDFGAETRIILVSADFSSELTTSVLWLNKSGLNIECVKIVPYKFNNKILINIQQIIPLPEAKDYLNSVKIKEREVKAAESSRRKKYKFRDVDYTKKDLVRAVIKYWVESENPKNIAALKEKFPQNGVFGLLKDIRDNDYFHTDYFTDKDDYINLPDGTCYLISAQWYSEGFEEFLRNAREKLGYEIEAVTE